MKELDRVNKFLQNEKNNIVPLQNEIIVSGPDTLRSIMYNETNKLNKLEMASNILLDYICDAKQIKALTYKEKQQTLRLIADMANNSRDFMIKMAELSSKNEFLKELLNQATKTKETVISENGEVFETLIDEDARKLLSEMVRNVVNERVRGS